jgi:hypothetical protein
MSKSFDSTNNLSHSIEGELEYFSNSESEEEWSGLEDNYIVSSSSYARLPLGQKKVSPEKNLTLVSRTSIDNKKRLFGYYFSQFCQSVKVARFSVHALLSINVYRNLLGAITALYFTVTGVQYWGTKYLSVAMNAPLPLVNSLFILCAATGPTSGYSSYFIN